jgi:WD40 repeat protein
VRFIGDGTRAASSGRDGRILIWDLGEGLQTSELTPGATVNGLAAADDGKTLYAAQADRTVAAWDLATGETLSTLSGHSGNVSGVALCDHNTRIVSASQDTSLLVWGSR